MIFKQNDITIPEFIIGAVIKLIFILVLQMVVEQI